MIPTHASLFSGIGNAVVPQLVKVIFETIKDYDIRRQDQLLN